MDSFEAVVQTLLLIGLAYGAVTTLRWWSRTVPRGGESDAEFANHPANVVAFTFESLGRPTERLELTVRPEMHPDMPTDVAAPR